jgi:hypothetical protein
VKEKTQEMSHKSEDGPSNPWLPEKSGVGNRRSGGIALIVATAILGYAGLGIGCGGSTSPSNATQSKAKSSGPMIPDEIQKAAERLLGSETTVLLFGDLANTGRQQFLAANVLPKTPTNAIPGTVVSRATIAEKQDDGQWLEIFHCDEHLKNTSGYLALTPLESVPSWRLQYEQDAMKGLELYLTALKMGSGQHVLPIGVRWNVATRRYQSLDMSYKQFLNENPALESPRSVLR